MVAKFEKNVEGVRDKEKLLREYITFSRENYEK
jgi:hypothetical protein